VFEFIAGARYFVYAYRESDHDKLGTNICTRTRQLSDAAEDVAYTRELAVLGPRTSILGIDSRGFESELEGADITVEGEGGKKYSAKAGRRGTFAIALERGGKYKVTIVGPLGFEFLNLQSSWRVFSSGGRPAVEFERAVQEGQRDFIDFRQFLTIR